MGNCTSIINIYHRQLYETTQGNSCSSSLKQLLLGQQTGNFPEEFYFYSSQIKKKKHKLNLYYVSSKDSFITIPDKFFSNFFTCSCHSTKLFEMDFWRT